MPRRCTPLACAALALILAALTPAHAGAAVPHAADGLSGTWQITRTCLAGCHGVTHTTALVRPVATDVFTATGHTSTGVAVSLVLYRLKAHVLVHGVKDSSLLTIEAPGQRMRGAGVGVNGSTFTTLWQCVSPAVASSATGAAGGTMRPASARAGARAGGRGNC